MNTKTHATTPETKMNRFLMVNAVAERAKVLQRGGRPLLDMEGKLTRPIDIALEEIKRGLLRVDATTAPDEPAGPAGNGRGLDEVITEEMVG